MSEWPPRISFLEAIGGAVVILGGTALLVALAFWPLALVSATGCAWFLLLLIPSLVLTAALMLWMDYR